MSGSIFVYCVSIHDLKADMLTSIGFEVFIYINTAFSGISLIHICL